MNATAHDWSAAIEKATNLVLPDWQLLAPWTYWRSPTVMATYFGCTKAVVRVTVPLPGVVPAERTAKPPKALDNGRRPTGKTIDDVLSQKLTQVAVDRLANWRGFVGTAYEPSRATLKKNCPNCRGSGRTDCPHCEQEMDCDSCEGEGKVEQEIDEVMGPPRFIRIGSKSFDMRFLCQLFTALPADDTIHVATSAKDGGEMLQLKGTDWTLVMMAVHEPLSEPVVVYKAPKQ